MSEPIKIFIRTAAGRLVEIEAKSTQSKDFAVHKRYLGKDTPVYGVDWCVTHIPTGLRIAEGYSCERNARLIAAVFGALPIQWGRVKSGKSIGAKLRNLGFWNWYLLAKDRFREE